MNTKPEESQTSSNDKSEEKKLLPDMEKLADEAVQLALRNLNHNAQVDNPEVR